MHTIQKQVRIRFTMWVNMSGCGSYRGDEVIVALEADFIHIICSRVRSRPSQTPSKINRPIGSTMGNVMHTDVLGRHDESE